MSDQRDPSSRKHCLANEIPARIEWIALLFMLSLSTIKQRSALQKLFFIEEYSAAKDHHVRMKVCIYLYEMVAVALSRYDFAQGDLFALLFIS